MVNVFVLFIKSKLGERIYSKISQCNSRKLPVILIKLAFYVNSTVSIKASKHYSIKFVYLVQYCEQKNRWKIYPRKFLSLSNLFFDYFTSLYGSLLDFFSHLIFPASCFSVTFYFFYFLLSLFISLYPRPNFWWYNGVKWEHSFFPWPKEPMDS